MMLRKEPREDGPASVVSDQPASCLSFSHSISETFSPGSVHCVELLRRDCVEMETRKIMFKTSSIESRLLQ